MFDQIELATNCLGAIYEVLLQQATNAMHDYLDNTSNSNLEQEPVLKRQRNSDKMRKRTGVCSSDIVANLVDGDNVVLATQDEYKIGWRVY